MVIVGKRLPALLNSYSAVAIRQMADGRTLKTTATRKAALLEALVADAPRPESVTAMLALLSPEQRAFLDFLLLYPGEISVQYIGPAAIKAGLVQEDARVPRPSYYYGYTYRSEPGDPRQIHSRRLPDLVAGLSFRVLALSSSGGSYSPNLELGVADHVAIPGEVRETLLQVTSAPPLVAEAPDQVTPGDARGLHRALFLLWSTLRVKPAGLTQAGLVRKVDARRLGQALGLIDRTTDFDAEPDLPYLYFLHRVALQLGLLADKGGQLEAAPRERLRDFLAAPWPVRTLRMLRAWMAFTAPDAVSLAATAGRLSLQSFAPATIQAGYSRLLGLLSGLPDSWLEVEGYLGWLRRHHFGVLLVPNEDPLLVYDLGTALYQVTYGLTAIGPDPYEATEGGLIRAALRQALHWLGLLDLGGAPGPAQTFRLTALGRALIAAEHDPAREADLLAPAAGTVPPGRVIVQPNFQVLAVGDVPDDILFALSEVAELVRVEQVVEFKLTRESVYAAQQAGWTALKILDLLRRAGDAPPAQNVARSILDWVAAHERIVFHRNATLLAAGTPAVLDRLAADGATAPLLGERLLPTLALVRPGPAGLPATLAALDSRLLAAGELPATSNLVEDPPVPAFHFDAAGRVIWKAALPDLRPLGLLAGLTRPGPDGTLALDERATRATALSRRWKPADVAALLDALAAWHSGPLPPAVERQIKIWGGYQGRAQLRTVTILAVERPELLEELRADPALAAVLAPLPAGTLAQVTLGPPRSGRAGRRPAAAPAEAASGVPDSLDAVRQTLLVQGFTLDEGE